MASAHYVTKIEIVKGSNVKKFELWYEDLNEELFKVKVSKRNHIIYFRLYKYMILILGDFFKENF